MSNDDALDNNDPTVDPLADELFDASADADNAEFDSAEFDSAEFDSAEFDGLSPESESRESEELRVPGESESRESTEIPLDTSAASTVEDVVEEDDDDDDDDDDIAQQQTAAAENEWLLTSFFSSLGIYAAVGITFFLDPDVIMKPTKNIDWAFATILIPISFICFMSASLGLLSKPRGKQWLLLVPTLGPILPIAVAALSIMALMNM
jgi:hypothetical protein